MKLCNYSAYLTSHFKIYFRNLKQRCWKKNCPDTSDEQNNNVCYANCSLL